MKRLSVISLTLLSLLAALLVGCGGSHEARVTAELDRADSLLRTSDTAAHSAALRQMLALDTARALRSDEALRARHALLLVQARYKCYVTIPADSALIDQARRYYADHHGSSADHERYTRSLIYSGAVAEELSHPQQAMQYYLEAEDTADPNDHFNLGFTNLRMAKLHHQYHLSDSIDTQRYRNASYHFNLAKSPHYQLICLTEIGTIFSATNLDSAKYYISRALGLAQNDPDHYFLAINYTNLSGAYFNCSKFGEARDHALNALNCGYGLTATEIPKCMMLLSRSYAGLGMIDSAQFYAKSVPSICSLADSVNYYCMMADIAKLCGDSAKYYLYYSKGSDAILRNDSLSPYYRIQIAETRFNENLKRKAINEEKSQKLLFILLSSLLIIAIICIILYFRTQTRRRKAESHDALLQIRQELEQTKAIMANERQRIVREKSNEAKLDKDMRKNQQSPYDSLQDSSSEKSVSLLSNVVEEQLGVMNQLVANSYLYENNPKRFLAEFTDAVSNRSIDKGFFKSLRQFVVVRYHLDLNALQSKYGLSNNEVSFICLSCCNVPTTVMMVCMGYSNIKSVGNKKQKIKKRVGAQSYDDFIGSLCSGQ